MCLKNDNQSWHPSKILNDFSEIATLLWPFYEEINHAQNKNSNFWTKNFKMTEFSSFKIEIFTISWMNKIIH